jgi:hypothetical protein
VELLPLHLENQQFPVSFQDACLAVIHPSHFFIHSPPICPSNTLASSPFRAPRVLIPSCTLGNPFFSSFPCSTSSHISVLNSISCAKKALSDLCSWQALQSWSAPLHSFCHQSGNNDKLYNCESFNAGLRTLWGQTLRLSWLRILPHQANTLLTAELSLLREKDAQ